MSINLTLPNPPHSARSVPSTSPKNSSANHIVFLVEYIDPKARKRRTAINIASSIKSDNNLFWNHLDLANVLLDQDELDEADPHIEQAKSYAVDDAYDMGRAMETQAKIWAQQRRLEDAKFEVSRAPENFERLGAANLDAERCRGLLQGWN